MQKIIKLTTIALAIIFSKQVSAQDTLHLDFGATQTTPDKAIEDKIVAWGKTLNGKKQDINIVAYYHKGEFKKFAEQRVEEMFLSVNRKVRDLVNIKTQEALKGENYQRTRVDIIYWPTGMDTKTVEAKKKEEEKAKKEEEKKKKEAEKSDKSVKKEDKKEDKKDDKAKKDEKKVEKKADKKEEKKEKVEKPKEEKKPALTKEEKEAAEAKKKEDKEKEKKEKEEKAAKEKAEKEAKKEQEKKEKEEKAAAEKAKKEQEKLDKQNNSTHQEYSLTV